MRGSCRGPAPAGSRGTLRMNGVSERRNVGPALMGPSLRGSERERERERLGQDMQQSLAAALSFTITFIP